MANKTVWGAGGIIPQVDWNQTDDNQLDYIKNKPTLGAIASKDTVEKADLAEDIQTLPTVTADDDGKVLMVQNGVWTLGAADITSVTAEPFNNSQVLTLHDAFASAVDENTILIGAI